MNDIKHTQILASGITVRQDFRECTRMVLFDTGDDSWRYATHGGTAFVVNFLGRPYAFTCRHVLKDFYWHQLVITDTKQGRLIAGIKAINYASDPKESAVETDILDVVVIQFSSDIDVSFFKDSAYLFDIATVVTSRPGDALYVASALKEKAEISDNYIKPVFCLLEYTDAPQVSNDSTLRHAIAHFKEPELNSITGISGAPVYNRRANALCGMVARGSFSEGRSEMWYIDLLDMMHLLKGVHEGRKETYYKKRILVPMR